MLTAPYSLVQERRIAADDTAPIPFMFDLTLAELAADLRLEYHRGKN
jgi:hypothetical protein